MLDTTIRGAAATPHYYLIGGGIASLAVAAFLIRDGDVRGPDITILEELGDLGGSLDASGPTMSRSFGVTDCTWTGRAISSKNACRRAPDAKS